MRTTPSIYFEPPPPLVFGPPQGIISGGGVVEQIMSNTYMTTNRRREKLYGSIILQGGVTGKRKVRSMKLTKKVYNLSTNKPMNTSTWN